MKTLFFVLLLLMSQPAWATITVDDTSFDYVGSEVAVVSSTAKNHTAGNALFVNCATPNTTGVSVVSVTDTAGDTFVGQASAKRSGVNTTRIEWFYVFSTAGHAANVVTCTFNFPVNLPQVTTVEVTHTAALSFDTASTSTAETFTTSYPVQTLTTAGAGILLFSATVGNGCAGGSSQPLTPAFTYLNCNNSYRITTGAEVGITPTGSNTSGDHFAAVCMSITEAGGPPPVSTNGRPLILSLRK